MIYLYAYLVWWLLAVFLCIMIERRTNNVTVRTLFGMTLACAIFGLFVPACVWCCDIKGNYVVFKRKNSDLQKKS